MSFLNSLKSCFSRQSALGHRPGSTQTRYKTRLQLETLEAREVPSGTLGDEIFLNFDEIKVTYSETDSTLNGNKQVVRSQTSDSIAVSTGEEPVQAIELDNIFISSYSVSGGTF